ncbi:MAG: ABC transporter ATP-binding protein [Tissierellia bacterium]|nr:ABC transporter ATP-binding protein [Tissierellia bacterium]
MGKTLFEIRNVSKYFSKVVANKDITFDINEGEVLAILGENGAGKSTIMKILYGLYDADQGEIKYQGKPVNIQSPKNAMAMGIAMVQQHFSLVPAHTIVENIILGNVKGTIDFKKERQKIIELSKEYNFQIPIDEKIRDLPVGVQQKVEILNALYKNAKLLILDEPTAVLVPEEIDTLMNFIKEYKNKGNSIVFISHKLKEVMEVADRIIVMRNGLNMGELKKEETDEKELSRLMIGRDLENVYNEEKILSEDISLKIEDLTYQTSQMKILDHIEFSVHKGEIFGIAGVSGNGQKSLCEALCGAISPQSGTMVLDGKELNTMSVKERIDYGLGYVAADRYQDAMIMDMSLTENMFLKSSFDKKWKKGIFVDYKSLRGYTDEKIKDYSIKASGPGDLGRSLSGGNQQKVVVAREMDLGSRFIIFDQPTRGLDLGAINYVHETILNAKKQGIGVLLISSELSEIFALSDRIAVIYQGRIQGIFHKSELDNEKIGLLMAGYYDKEARA